MTSYFNVCDVKVANSKPQTLPIFFLFAFVPPHFEKRSATHE